MVRVVVDTNILVSALISKKISPPLEIYNLMKSENFLLVTSRLILEELEDVLGRKEITKLHQRTPEQIQRILAEIAETSVVVPGLVIVEIVKADPDDDIFIAAAIEGKAEYIITGDRALLNLIEYQRIKIVTPANFLHLINQH